jgi:hypothetical protein
MSYNYVVSKLVIPLKMDEQTLKRYCNGVDIIQGCNVSDTKKCLECCTTNCKENCTKATDGGIKNPADCGQTCIDLCIQHLPSKKGGGYDEAKHCSSQINENMGTSCQPKLQSCCHDACKGDAQCENTCINNTEHCCTTDCGGGDGGDGGDGGGGDDGDGGNNNYTWSQHDQDVFVNEMISSGFATKLQAQCVLNKTKKSMSPSEVKNPSDDQKDQLKDIINNCWGGGGYKWSQYDQDVFVNEMISVGATKLQAQCVLDKTKKLMSSSEAKNPSDDQKDQLTDIINNCKNVPTGVSSGLSTLSIIGISLGGVLLLIGIVMLVKKLRKRR